MVSRTRAFTIATAWILAGLILGIAGFSAAAGASSDGLRAAIVGSLLWVGILLAGCLIVAALWVRLAHATPARRRLWAGRRRFSGWRRR